MVLHNSKWDRRAKTRYLKKHGLPSKGEERNPNDQSKNINGHEKAADKADAAAASTNPSGTATEGTDELSNLEQGIEIDNAFPDVDEGDDEEMQSLRRRSKEQFEQQQHTNQNTHSPEKSHIQVGSKDMFERAQAGAARSKLNSQVKRFTKKHSDVDSDSDSDFEDFMDNSDSAESSDEKEQPVADLAVNPPKSFKWNEDKLRASQALLDKTIGR